MQRLCLAIILLSLVDCSGCSSIMHELQPHRLWRLNYQDPAGRTDGVYYSVEDHLVPSSSKSASVSATVPGPSAAASEAGPQNSRR